RWRPTRSDPESGSQRGAMRPTQVCWGDSFGGRVAHLDVIVSVDFDRLHAGGNRGALPHLRRMEPAMFLTDEDLYRHTEAVNDILPAVSQLSILHRVREYRHHGGGHVLLEHAAEVDPRPIVDVRLDLLARHDRVAEVGLNAAQNPAPQLIVVDDLADHVQHRTHLVVHVARALPLHP